MPPSIAERSKILEKALMSQGNAKDFSVVPSKVSTIRTDSTTSGSAPCTGGEKSFAPVRFRRPVR